MRKEEFVDIDETISFRCAECDNPLTLIYTPLGDIIKVTLCENCGKSEYQSGYNDGYDEAYNRFDRDHKD